VRIAWSPLAIDRTIAVIRYIATANPQSAERWTARLFERVNRLRSFPESGRILRESPRGPYRELLHGEYRIIYRVVRSRVLILTVRHGRRLLDPGELA